MEKSPLKHRANMAWKSFHSNAKPSNAKHIRPWVKKHCVVVPAVPSFCDFSFLFKHIEPQILHLSKRGNEDAWKLPIHVQRVHAYYTYLHMDTYGLGDNCHERLSVGRGNPPWVLSTPHNCIGCQECQALPAICSLPSLFLRGVCPASSLEDWGKGDKEYAYSQSHRFPKLTSLSSHTDPPQVQHIRGPLHVAPWDLGQREVTGTYSSACMLCRE